MELKPVAQSIIIAYQAHPIAPLADRRGMVAVTDGRASVRDVLLSAGVDPYQPITVQLDGRMLTIEEWDTVCPTEGQLLSVKAEVADGGGGGGSNPLQVVAMIAVVAVAAVVAGPAGAAFIGNAMGVSATTAATLATIAGAVIMVGGSLLIGALFPPKSPTTPNAPPQVSPTYSLSGGQNRSRPYEPMPVVMGRHRVFLDYAARPYAEYRGGDQYLYQIFHLGLGNVTASDFRIGTTPLTSYSDYQLVYPDANGKFANFPGNVDSAQGAPLTYSGGAVTRTTSADTYQIGIDLESVLFYAADNGSLESRTVTATLQYRPVGGAWTSPASVSIYGLGFTYSGGVITTSNNTQKPNRASLYIESLTPGTYEVRITRTTPDTSDSRESTQFSWSVLKSYQLDQSDYAGQNRIGLIIRASEQINGVVQQFSAMIEAKATYYNGSSWVTGFTDNPAHWAMHFSRGVYAEKLLYGVGLSASQLDLPALVSWANFCAAEGLTFNGVLDTTLNCFDVLTMLGTAGFGSPSWGSGKLGVVFDSRSASPVMTFGMSNIIRDSFEVAYISENLAEELVVRFRNPDKDYEQDEVRTLAPNVVSPTRTSAVDLFGCTDADMAGKFANYLAAQQYYRRRRVTWQSDFEGFTCQRGDVVLLSHDLTQWGYSGRLVGVNGNTVTLDRPVPRQNQIEYLMLIRPDGQTYTYDVAGSTDEQSDTLTLDGFADLQEGFALMDHRWCFSPLETPGKKLKILSVQPASDSRLSIIATDEYEEFYDAWDGTFVAPPTETLLPKQPVEATSLTVTSRVALVNGYLVNRVVTSWGVSGSTLYSQVRAYLDGNLIHDAQHTVPYFEIDVSGAGAFYVEVTPVGLTGSGTTKTATLNLVALDLPQPPASVELTGEEGRSATFKWTPVVGVQAYVIEIFANSAVRRTVNVGNSLTYTYRVEDAQADGGPFRSYAFRVYSVNQAGQSNSFAEVLFSNPQIGQLQNASVEAMPNSLWFNCDKPTESDFAGIKLWISKTIGFTPGPSTLAYDGPETFVTLSADADGNPLESGVVYFVRAAGYDTFGDDNLTLTAELSAAILSPAWGLLEGDINEMLLESGLRDRIDLIEGIQIKTDLIDGIQSDIEGIQTKTALIDGLRDDIDGMQPRVDLIDGIQTDIEAIEVKTDLIDGIVDDIQDIQTEVGRIDGVQARVDLIDTLPVAEIETRPIAPQTGLVSIVRNLSGEISAIGRKSDTIAESLLNAVLKTQNNADLIYDAGVRVDSGSGQVYIFGVREAQNRLDSAEIRLDAAEANINLKATTNYVDEAIAQAVLDPSQVAELSGLNARIGQAEVDIDGLDAAITLKADLLTVQDQEVRLGQAEVDINALESEIALKASNTDLDGVEARVSSAETTLGALDIPGITQTVTDVRSLKGQENELAQTQLKDILTGEANYQSLNTGIARARQDLTAYVDEGLNAEAASRLALEVQVGENATAIQQESVARANAIEAEAQQRSALSAVVAANSADILAESALRVTGDEALAEQVNVLQVNIDENTSLITTEAQARVDGDEALAQQIETLSSTVDDNTSAVQSEAQTRADADSALASQIDTVVANVQDNTAAIQSEAQTRADEDLALATQIGVVQAVANAKNKTYRQNSAPTGDLTEGDLWYKSNDNNKPHRWSGSAWVVTEDPRVAQNVAAIQSEANARADADSAMAQQIDTLTAQADENSAAIQTESEARADGDSALAQQIVTLQAEVDGNGAAIQNEASVRADADLALSEQITTLQSSVDNNTAAIQNESTARADQDSAIAAQVGTVQAVVTRNQDTLAEAQLRDLLTGERQYQDLKGGIAVATQEMRAYTDGELLAEAQARLDLQVQLGEVGAALEQESTTRASGDEALASQVVTLQAEVASSAAAIQAESSVRAESDDALAQQITQLVAGVEVNAAAIQGESQVRADADEALATQVDTLLAATDENAAAIQSESTARADADTALAQQITQLQAATEETAASIQVESTARADADTALAGQITELASSVDENSAAIQTEAQARADEDSALSGRIDTVQAQTQDNFAAIQSEETARADADAALADQIVTLQSSVDDNTALIQNESNTRADEDSALARQIGSVQATVLREQDTLAEAQLKDLLTGERQYKDLKGGIAIATQEMRAYTDGEVLAEAQARLVLLAQLDSTRASLEQESTARATADEAITGQVVTLQASVGENTAAIQSESEARADADSVLAGQVETLVGWVGENEAAIQSESSIRADADSALASQIETLVASTDDNAAAIQTEAQARVDADEAIAQQIVTLQSEVNDNTSAIQAESTARSDADNALAQQIDTLIADVGENTAVIQSESTTRADADQALAQQLDALASQVGDNAAAIQTESTARTDADSALAQQIDTLQAEVNDNASAIQIESTTRADADSALARQVTTLQSSSGAAAGIARKLFWGFDEGLEGWSAIGGVTSVSGGVLTLTPAGQTRIQDTLATAQQFPGADASIIRCRIRRVSGSDPWYGRAYYSTPGHSWSSSYYKSIPAPGNPDVWNELEWDMSDLTAGGNDYVTSTITGLRLDPANSGGTSVWEIDWITVGSRSVTPYDAAIQVAAETIDGIQAKYTVKIDNNGYVSGYGLISSPNNGVPFADFAVIANRFSLAPVQTDPNGDSQVPFFVLTAPTTIDGVTQQAGSYLKNALIQIAAISTAKIENLAVTNQKVKDVSASKLTAGKIAVGEHIESTDYVTGVSGWRINGNGNAELSNAVVRGTVYATDGEFAGTVKAGSTLLGGVASAYTSGTGMYAGGTSSSNYRFRVGNPTGARMQWNGSAVQIYNSSNQLVMTSGGIAADFVSGLGGFATLNKLTPDNISTYMDSAAIGSAYIANAAITNTKIGNAAITSAKVDDAAIINAKIANLAVDTIKIAGEAVTFIRTLTSTFSVGGFGTVTRTLNVPSGGNTNIVFWSVYSASGGGGTGCFVKLWRGGVEAVTLTFSGLTGAIDLSKFYPDSSGPSTYQITVENLNSQSSSFSVELTCIGRYK